MFRTDDLERDFDRWDAHQARMEARLPRCENRRCQKRIDDEFYFDIEGEILCEECARDRYRKRTDVYVEI